MSDCRNEVTNEEFFAYLDVAPAEGYPKKISHGGKNYLVIAKDFTHTGKITKKERHMLSVEIWNEEMLSKKIGVVLVKSDGCRFHSPSNPNFNMVPELFGTDEGKFYLNKMLEVLSEFDFGFLIEEVFGEDVGYNYISKSYDKGKYAKLRDFFVSSGFTFTFNKAKGKGLIVLKGKGMGENEKKCFSHVKKEASKVRPVPAVVTMPPPTSG